MKANENQSHQTKNLRPWLNKKVKALVQLNGFKSVFFEVAHNGELIKSSDVCFTHGLLCVGVKGEQMVPGKYYIIDSYNFLL